MHEADLAIYKTVHEHGGAERLSKFLAIRPGTLNNKADPACDGHQLTVREAIALQLATDTRKIIQAEASALGGVFVPGVNWAGVSDVQLLDAWAHLQVEHGQTARCIQQALSDGIITREELRSIRREIYEDFQAAMELLARLQGLCDDADDGL
jgi:hypothetical protein